MLWRGCGRAVKALGRSWHGSWALPPSCSPTGVLDATISPATFDPCALTQLLLGLLGRSVKSVIHEGHAPLGGHEGQETNGHDDLANHAVVVQSCVVVTTVQQLECAA